MVQNHLLQLLCLVAMEPPTYVGRETVRDEKLKVLQALQADGAGDDVDRDTVARPVRRRAGRRRRRAVVRRGPGPPRQQHRDLRGAQGRGAELALGRRAVLPAHRQADGPPGSRRSWWSSRSRRTRCSRTARASPTPNRLHIQVQPDEGMRLHLTAKEPGPGGIRLRPVSLDLSYATAFDQRLARRLRAAAHGRHRAATRPCSCAATRSRPRGSWVEPILDRWASLARPPQALPGRHHRPDRRRHAPRARRPHLAGARPVKPASIPSSPRSPSASSSAAAPAGRRTSSASTPPATAARPAAGWPAPTSRTASPPPSPRDKQALRGRTKPNVAIVSSYNDMLSAHQPFETYPPRAQEGRDPRRRHRPVRRRRAGHVRRHHPGPRRHAALAVQPRRDRDVDRDRALARHVRRRADARRLRQDRARPADRRAVLRPPADGLRAGRADGLGPAERREGRGSASCTPRARSAARSCSRPRRRRTTRPAPAPSTAPPTPTSC